MSQEPEVQVVVDDHTERVHPASQAGFIHGLMHAIHGVLHVFEHEHNARVHLVAAILAFAFGLILRVSDVELAAVFFAVVIVFLTEIFNTIIERTLDLIDIQENPRIKLIKDMAAGAVLVAAVAAVLIGTVIFGPHILRLIWPN